MKNWKFTLIVATLISFFCIAMLEIASNRITQYIIVFGLIGLCFIKNRQESFFNTIAHGITTAAVLLYGYLNYDFEYAYGGIWGGTAIDWWTSRVTIIDRWFWYAIVVIWVVRFCYNYYRMKPLW